MAFCLHVCCCLLPGCCLPLPALCLLDACLVSFLCLILACICFCFVFASLLLAHLPGCLLCINLIAVLALDCFTCLVARSFALNCLSFGCLTCLIARSFALSCFAFACLLACLFLLALCSLLVLLLSVSGKLACFFL